MTVEGASGTGGGALTEEMRAEWDGLKKRLSQLPDPSKLTFTESRRLDQGIHAFWNIDMPSMEDVRRLKLPGDQELQAQDCDAVIFRPKQVESGTILFVHGGGWCFCNLDTHERFMRSLAEASHKHVIGIHYRLAPENPFPAGLTDVVSAFRTVLSSRTFLGLSDGPVVIAGDSAGGNLALAAMLHEAKAHRPLAAGALLFYGAFGIDFLTPSYQLYATDYWLTEPAIRQAWNWYLPEPAMRKDPLAVPLMASDELLTTLPPLFLAAAEVDVLASDTLELKSRLDRLGRSDLLHVEPGVIHGFLQMTSSLKAARYVTALAAEAARRFIDVAPS
jgi:acetyl esterase